MQAYAHFADLAQVCAKQAHAPATAREVARALWLMAIEYQRKAAAAVDNGEAPDIGQPPAWFVG